MKMKIMEAIKSIPEKKEKLREAFDALQSYSSSSSLVSFNLKWEDIDNHFSTIEKSIDDRIKALQSSSSTLLASIFVVVDDDDDDNNNNDNNNNNKPEPEAAAAATEPEAATLISASARPELRSLCANMNAKGLRAYISNNWSDFSTMRNELASAIRCAPDPAQLVLYVMAGFYPSNSNPNSKSKSKYKSRSKRNKPKEGDVLINRRMCIDLLETLYLISSEIEIKPPVRENAMKFATQWKSKIPLTGDNALEVIGFLHFIASYGLVPDFSSDDVFDLFIAISRRRHASDLIRSLGLVHKLPDLIQKLNSKGRQFDAVKFVYAFNATDKFPPVPLLKAYITETKKIAQEVLNKGLNSVQAQNEAASKELGALRSVIKAVSEYNLESEFPLEELERRITELEQKRIARKRTGTGTGTGAAAAPGSNPQHQQQSNKRQRSLGDVSVGLISSNPYRPPFVQTLQPPAEHTPYMGVASAGPYGYTHAGPSLSSTGLGHHGGTRSPPRTYHCPPVESHAVTSSSGGTYDRPVELIKGFPLSALPSLYGSSLHP